MVIFQQVLLTSLAFPSRNNQEQQQQVVTTTVVPPAVAPVKKKKRRRRRGENEPAALSWDMVLAIRAGKRTPPYPEDFFGPGFDPTEPSSAMPGSDAKVQVMMLRAERCERLFHPDDARWSS